MPFLVICKCGKKLRVADEDEGKKVRCQACQSLVRARAEPAPDAVPKAPAEERPGRKPTPKTDLDEDDEAPSKPRARKAARDTDDDEDERPARKEKKKGSMPWLWVGCG